MQDWQPTKQHQYLERCSTFDPGRLMVNWVERPRSLAGCGADSAPRAGSLLGLLEQAHRRLKTGRRRVPFKGRISGVAVVGRQDDFR